MRAPDRLRHRLRLVLSPRSRSPRPRPLPAPSRDRMRSPACRRPSPRSSPARTARASRSGTAARARRRKADFSRSLISPINSTTAAVDQRADPREVVLVGAVHLGGDLQRCRPRARCGSRDRAASPGRCGRGRRGSPRARGGVSRSAGQPVVDGAAQLRPGAARAGVGDRHQRHIAKLPIDRRQVGQVEPAMQRRQERGRRRLRSGKGSSRGGSASRRTRRRGGRTNSSISMCGAIASRTAGSSRSARGQTATSSAVVSNRRWRTG